MSGYDDVGWCLVAGSLAILLSAVLVRQVFQRRRFAWLTSGVVGILLGSAVPYSLMRLEGYEFTKSILPHTGTSTAAQPDGQPTGGRIKDDMTDVPGIRTEGDWPKLDLATLVQKLNVLTGDITITFTAEQSAAVVDCLGEVESVASMSHDEAKAKYDRLMGLLSESQKASLKAIALPAGSVMGCPMSANGSGPKQSGCSKQGEGKGFPQQLALGRTIKSLRERITTKEALRNAETSKIAPAR